jgi:hypothetical protein
VSGDSSPGRTLDPGWPAQAAVERVHDRFVREVVEDLGLCPFARKSRELGRVHRPVFRVGSGDPTAEECARVLAELLERAPDAEIVLLTFPVPRGHAWTDPARFDRFVAAVREAYQAGGRGPVFYMVGFHPDYASDPTRPTADSLVPLLRRTPDPVIQCVRAEILDHVRRQAQDVARQRTTRDLARRDPELAALFERSIQPDPELSADIARQNWATVGAGSGRDRLDRLVADIRRERDRLYGESP